MTDNFVVGKKGALGAKPQTISTGQRVTEHTLVRDGSKETSRKCLVGPHLRSRDDIGR